MSLVDLSWNFRGWQRQFGELCGLLIFAKRIADLLEVYSDADYANAVTPKRRSRSGVQINLAGCAIDWKGVLQKTTAFNNRG